MFLKRSNVILEEHDIEKNNKKEIKRRKICETTKEKFKEVKINIYIQEICSGPMSLGF